MKSTTRKPPVYDIAVVAANGDDDATWLRKSLNEAAKPLIKAIVAKHKQARKAQKKGHEKVHGTPEQKKARYADFQAEVDRQRAQHPDWRKSDVKRHAVKELKKAGHKQVSETTLKRNTRDSGRKNS